MRGGVLSPKTASSTPPRSCLHLTRNVNRTAIPFTLNGEQSMKILGTLLQIAILPVRVVVEFADEVMDTLIGGDE